MDLLRAFADDIGLVAKDLFSTIRLLKPIFDIIDGIAALRLNVAKCIIIPLWPYRDDDLKEVLGNICPGWQAMQLADAAKYLGFYVGPGIDDKDWERVLDVLSRIDSSIRTAGLSRLKAFQSFLTYGVAHLYFVAQLRRPPESLRKLELACSACMFCLISHAFFNHDFKHRLGTPIFMFVRTYVPTYIRTYVRT